MKLLTMNEKAWIWTAMDGSDETRDGTPVLEKFAVRFKEIETAKEFEKVFNENKPSDVVEEKKVFNRYSFLFKSLLRRSQKHWRHRLLKRRRKARNQVVNFHLVSVLKRRKSQRLKRLRLVSSFLFQYKF